ncbi:MAG: helix-turn-helix domain-containing protein [Alphaproteobacteria bacterium]|nr:helix-turn-helix domain-containing protein [Alphaproteobacteria bacterium]
METLLTPDQTAEHLCISEMTLRKWRWEGKGPRFVKMGRKVLYRQIDLNDYVEGQVRVSTSDMGEVTQCNT